MFGAIYYLDVDSTENIRNQEALVAQLEEVLIAETIGSVEDSLSGTSSKQRS